MFFFLYRKYPTLMAISVSGLVNYWPVMNGSVNDVIGGKHANSSAPTFTTDKAGNANSAILINSATSIWRLPANSYINGDFTVTAWVKNNDCVNPNNISTLFF
jgi:hypothetical protein